jgi:hypothetical protein
LLVFLILVYFKVDIEHYTQTKYTIMTDNPKEQVETAPDPDEDDLDDLDGTFA